MGFFQESLAMVCGVNRVDQREMYEQKYAYFYYPHPTLDRKRWKNRRKYRFRIQHDTRILHHRKYSRWVEEHEQSFRYRPWLLR